MYMNTTARNFALQLGALASLYLSLAFLLVLLFGVINLTFPDATDQYWNIESAASSVRLGFAMVIVFFPTYLILTRTVNKIRRSEAEGAYLGLTRWLIYLSLLVGGAVLLGDLVAVIMAFLEGEITQRFIFKAAAVLLVTGAAFHYYLLDARGHWMTNERQSIIYGVSATIIVLTSLGYSIMNVAAPSEVREYKLDNEQVGHLQDMQWRIEDYYRSNEALPENLATVYGAFEVPTAPEDRETYRYEITDDQTYELCATFAFDSTAAEFQTRSIAAPGLEKNYNWNYKAGDWCFERQIEEVYKQ